jgi:uncharacterized protein (UPF0248 family)
MTGRSSIKNLVKKIIWSQEKENYTIFLVDRLSATGTRVITGDEIDRVSVFDQLVLKDGSIIPLHRIRVIKYKDKVLLERKERRPKS